MGHPRGTHSRYVIGCCLIPLGICGLKNNSRRITYGIGCVRRMPFLSPLSSLVYTDGFVIVVSRVGEFARRGLGRDTKSRPSSSKYALEIKLV